MAKMTTLKEFESIFPTIVEDLLAHAKLYGAPQMALDWFKTVRAQNTLMRL
jgi:farnesyl diphosphate synthase